MKLENVNGLKKMNYKKCTLEVNFKRDEENDLTEVSQIIGYIFPVCP